MHSVQDGCTRRPTLLHYAFIALHMFSLPWVSLFRKLSLSACFLNGCGSTANTTGFVGARRYFGRCVYRTVRGETCSPLYQMRSFMIPGTYFGCLFFGLGLETIFGFHPSRAGLHLSRKNVGDLLDRKSWPWRQCVCFWANFQYQKHAFTWVIRLDLILLWYAWRAL